MRSSYLATILIGLGLAGASPAIGDGQPVVVEQLGDEESPATDEERLLALHRDAMEAHLERDVDKLMAAEAADAVFASRGEISRPSLDERRAMFGPYFESTEFGTYRDMVPPIVEVSDDGTLGWVIAQVEVSGTQRGSSGEPRPFQFQSAWIELYGKRDGDWMRIGNVSNFAER